MKFGIGLLTLLCASFASSTFGEPMALHDVTVIPMTGEGALKHRVVVVEEGRILAIEKVSKFSKEGHSVVDCSGKFLIPGLWDMHVHLSGIGASAIPLFLANGVTGVRDMGGVPSEVLSWRDEIDAGDRQGPRVKTAGPVLESPRFVQRMYDRKVSEPVELTRVAVGSPEAAEAAIQRVRDMGVDFFKIRTFANRDTYLAIAKAAKDADMKLVGHAGLSYKHLLAGGQASYEHFPSQLLNGKSEEERSAIWREMAQKGVAVVPTIVNYTHSILLPIDKIEGVAEDMNGETDPRRRYVSSAMLDSWREQIIDRKESASPNYDRLIEGSYRNFKEMHDEGVRILPGTDTPVLLMYPGFSLHDEVAELVEHVGMSPHEALMNATRHSAEFLGLGDSLGTIEVGKQADLVLLNANPLKDIESTTKIETVLSQGNYYDRAALDAMLSETEEKAAK